MLVSKLWLWRALASQDLSWALGGEIDDLVWLGLSVSQVRSAIDDREDALIMRGASVSGRSAVPIVEGLPMSNQEQGPSCLYLEVVKGATGQWRWSILEGPEGAVEIAGGGGYCCESDAWEDGSEALGGLM